MTIPSAAAGGVERALETGTVQLQVNQVGAGVVTGQGFEDRAGDGCRPHEKLLIDGLLLMLGMVATICLIVVDHGLYWLMFNDG